MLSRRSVLLLLALAVVIVPITVRNVAWEPQPIPRVSPPRTSLDCFRKGGELTYCRCLDRLEEARAVAGRPAPKLPPLDHPVVKYALRRPRLYPVITGDTLRCLTPPPAPAPGQRAGAGVTA